MASSLRGTTPQSAPTCHRDALGYALTGYLAFARLKSSQPRCFTTKSVLQDVLPQPPLSPCHSNRIRSWLTTTPARRMTCFFLFYPGFILAIPIMLLKTLPARHSLRVTCNHQINASSPGAVSGLINNRHCTNRAKGSSAIKRSIRLLGRNLSSTVGIKAA